MPRSLAVWLVVAAAAAGCTRPTCPEGQLRNQYGDCLDPDPNAKAPIPEGGESLPPCERLPVGDEGDRINRSDEYDLGVAFCEGRGGAIQANFDDDNNDGIPDAGDEAFGLYLYEPYAGSSAGGLGVGVSLRCFLEDFIAINDIETNEVDGETQIVEVFFDNPSMFIHDDYVLGEYDGLVSWISLYGP